MAFDQSKLAFGVCYVEGRESAQVFFTPRHDILVASKTIDRSLMVKLRQEVIRLWAKEISLAEKQGEKYMPVARPHRANRSLFEEDQ